MIDNNRYYYFGPSENNLHMIIADNGKYLKPDRIKHYEDIYGPLYSVQYHGKTIMA